MCLLSVLDAQGTRGGDAVHISCLMGRQICGHPNVLDTSTGQAAHLQGRAGDIGRLLLLS